MGWESESKDLRLIFTAADTLQFKTQHPIRRSDAKNRANVVQETRRQRKKSFPLINLQQEIDKRGNSPPNNVAPPNSPWGRRREGDAWTACPERSRRGPVPSQATKPLATMSRNRPHAPGG